MIRCSILAAVLALCGFVHGEPPCCPPDQSPLPKAMPPTVPLPLPLPGPAPLVVPLPPGQPPLVPLVPQVAPVLPPPVVVLPGVVPACLPQSCEVQILVVRDAYREVVLYGGTTFALYKQSLERASVLAKEADFAKLDLLLQDELKKLILPKVGLLMPPCCDGEETCQADHLREWVGIIRGKWKTAKEADQPRLTELAKILDRSAFHASKLQQMKGEACMLSELHCRMMRCAKVVAPPPVKCWTDCEIASARRLRDAALSLHGQILSEYVVYGSTLEERWSVSKAKRLAGSSDTDVEAVAVWAHELRLAVKGTKFERETNVVLDNPKECVALWVIARRQLLCRAKAFYGDELINDVSWKKTIEQYVTVCPRYAEFLDLRWKSLLPECDCTKVAVPILTK